MSEKLLIFLAEDNPADVFLINEALATTQLNFDLFRVSDGEAALKALERMERDGTCINLVLLDLNLPKVSGHELLAHIFSSERLRKTPVVVLTSSDSPYDRAKTSASTISHYFLKPTDYNDFLRLGRVVEDICNGTESAQTEGAGR